MAETLGGKIIWLTRPAGTIGQLAQRLEACGAEVLQAPLLEIHPLAPQDPAATTARHLARQLSAYQHLIFISGNAVQHGLPYLGTSLPATCQAYAIGRATAELLSQVGIEAQFPEGPESNSEALLQLPSLQGIAGERVLIVRGLGGREYLAQALRQRGALVDYLEAYRRSKSGTLPALISDRLAAGSIDVIQASSGETVAGLVELVAEELQSRLFAITLIVPGERVARIARNAGFQRVVVALNAGDDAILKALGEAGL